jgi:hypothetical protein
MSIVRSLSIIDNTQSYTHFTNYLSTNQIHEYLKAGSEPSYDC